MSVIAAYIFMVVSIIFSVANSCILHKFSNKGIENKGDLFLFNAGISTVWSLIMTLWFLFSEASSISLTAIIFGLVYGVLLCLFLFFKTVSMSEGPVSLTTLIGSCAFIIATFFGVIYSHEAVNIVQLIGMLILMFSLGFCVNPKKSGEKLTKKWFFYAFLFFLAGGLLGIFNKFFGVSDVTDEVTGMMLVASFFSVILFAAFSFSINASAKKPIPKIRKEALLYIILSGAASCIYMRLNVILAGIIPSVVFFPVSNGSMVILSTLAGKIFFKEKLKTIQTMGILIGFVAIIITGLGQAFG